MCIIVTVSNRHLNFKGNEKNLNILISIDDTDNLESRGSGKLAQELADAIEDRGWGSCTRVTRHQLFVHEQIPYTSHNSSMCFEVSIDQNRLDTIISYGKEYLVSQSAEGSDPGLCVAVNGEKLNREKLIQFGLMAKKSILSKDMAYTLAEELGIHLSEHGGTGDGIIGALAGTGLRLSGNDGRYRGWYNLGLAGDKITVETLCRYDFIDEVQTVNGIKLDNKQVVTLGDKMLKVTLCNGHQVILVNNSHTDRDNPVTHWTTLSKQELKAY